MTPHILILTGNRGSGKTTLCKSLIERKTAEGRAVSGLLSPARFDSKEKTGILTVDICTGEKRLLASKIDDEISGFQFGIWTFDPEVLAWGNEVLRRSIPADLFIIDEIGPLEFAMSIGWTNVFDALASGRYRAALVIVRPDYLRSAKIKLRPDRIFDIDSPGRSRLEKILQVL